VALAAPPPLGEGGVKAHHSKRNWPRRWSSPSVWRPRTSVTKSILVSASRTSCAMYRRSRSAEHLDRKSTPLRLYMNQPKPLHT
jgi:hypothetical protein